MESRARSLAKSLSWRVVGALTTFVIGLVVTHSVNIAMSLSVIETVSKLLLFYGHERLWAHLRFGRPAATTPQVSPPPAETLAV